tara:strand:- start:3497 stop:4057 length:561 start_codon:yes stop_codon:yes gene_type:complete
MSFATYVFKPKHHLALTMKVIDFFTEHACGWTECGAYTWLKLSPSVRDQVGKDFPAASRLTSDVIPEGYVKMTVEVDMDTRASDSPFSEVCFERVDVTSEILANDMLVLLDQAGFFHRNVADGCGPDYNLEDAELHEIINYLSAPGTRSLAFDEDEVIITSVEGDEDGKLSMKVERKNLIEYALTT